MAEEARIGAVWSVVCNRQKATLNESEVSTLDIVCV